MYALLSFQYFKTCQFHLTYFIFNEFSFHSVKSKQFRIFLFTGPIHIKTFCHLYTAVTDADLFRGRFLQTFLNVILICLYRI